MLVDRNTSLSPRSGQEDVIEDGTCLNLRDGRAVIKDCVEIRPRLEKQQTRQLLTFSERVVQPQLARTCYIILISSWA